MTTTSLPPESDDHAPIEDGPQQWAAEDAQFVAQLRTWAIVGLLLIGFFLVGWANSLGIALASDAGGGWDHNEATQIALTMRILGAMLFGAGLLERVLLRWEHVTRLRGF